MKSTITNSLAALTAAFTLTAAAPASAKEVSFQYPSDVNMPGGERVITIDCDTDIDWTGKRPNPKASLAIKLDTNDQVKYNSNLTDGMNKRMAVNHIASAHKVCVDEAAYTMYQESSDKSPQAVKQNLRLAWGPYAASTMQKIHHPKLREILDLDPNTGPSKKTYCPIHTIIDQCAGPK